MAYEWQHRMEFGNFRVDGHPNKFEPGNPMIQDRISMGMPLGNNLVILYSNHDEVTDFEVVNTETGDSIQVHVATSAEFENLWNDLEPEAKAEFKGLLLEGKKISAIKVIRRELGLDLKTAKRFVDSGWLINVL